MTSFLPSFPTFLFLLTVKSCFLLVYSLLHSSLDRFSSCYKLHIFHTFPFTIKLLTWKPSGCFILWNVLSVLLSFACSSFCTLLLHQIYLNLFEQSGRHVLSLSWPFIPVSKHFEYFYLNSKWLPSQQNICLELSTTDLDLLFFAVLSVLNFWHLNLINRKKALKNNS